ncbi:DUF3298 and DUF4163 domain-containing protein [Paenibacillus alkaliterrae]|uniref:DUF3298 and DUF4163 domain-containing protein n=1 Tax=Paenibacillus alkaliterrae TaxID=320909 RepID=UPI001F460A62|nr:DUF3298 and DUF4163 domain-containing protein [Paenibacillus alkaliterrae]MCF2938256.1 DUF3298 and DUF4163 domain-containing protein [Paenibacillus alkaliterrae]
MSFQAPVVIQTVNAAFPKAELSLPHVSGGPSEAADNKINKKIHETVQQLVNSQGSLDDPRAQMIGYYEQKTNEKDYLSLSLFNYAYTGGAHGLTLQESLTFKQSTGQTFTLEQLFKPGSDYVKRISAIVSAQIKARAIDTLEPFTAIRPDQDYYVADRSLVIYFQLYELAAYVYGFLYFPISVYELQDIINEEGPLGPMTVND